MAISSPVILLPSGGADYTTDTQTQTLSGTTTAAKEIKVNGSNLGVSYTPGETIWSWTGNLILGENLMSVVAVQQTTLDESLPATITVTLISSDQFITVAPPTGVRIRRYQDKVEIICSKSPEVVQGYNFYISTQSGGVNDVYSKINTSLITEYSFYTDTATELSQTVNTAGTIRVTTITEEILRTYYFSTFLTQDRFNQMVAAGSLPNIAFNSDARLFFVVTGVIYDSALGQVSESSYSVELEGSPITITTGIKDLPGRTQNDIVLTYSQELLTSDDGIDTKPGTALRDMIDPISEEQARIYVIQDFLSRSLSVSALLDFDDSDGDGVSDPVSSSIKKRSLQVALNLSNPDDVQTLINDQFDKLASNVNVMRKGSEPAVGTVVFYTESPPIRDMFINEGSTVSTNGDLDSGIQSQSYRTTTTKVLDVASRDSYYNTKTKRYEVEIDVVAVSAGTAGNTDSYTIKNMISGADSDFLVENSNPISFGTDLQTNYDLATDIELAFFIDTGTEGGYVKTTVAVPGVRNVRVEKAGDSLMRRDYDPITQEHIGGKVDIYIQGRRTQQITDQVAFSYQSISASQGLQSAEIFTVVNAASFQFQTNNARVTAHTPIFEVTKVRNSTRGADYDLTNLQIIGDGTIVDLDETRSTNIQIGLASTDVIRVDYKYRSSDVYILQHQPVLDIVSVTGQLSGELTSDNWEIVRLQDPLEEGNSTIAKDGLRIKFANNLPVTEFQNIFDEEHVLIVDTDESLDLVGADANTVSVTNQDKTVFYVKNADYTVSSGTESTATTIRMIESGSILNGQTVLVNYTAEENFSIVYTTNSLLGDVQTQVDNTKHACADVIVKQAVENRVDFVLTVVPKPGVTNFSQLTSKIQTAISNFVTQQGVGVSLTQSDIIYIINGIADVDYVVVPFIRMVKADGSLIVRDDIGKTQFQIYNQGLVTSYITAASNLTYTTVDKGGPENLFRGVFEDNMPVVLMSDPLDVSAGAGRAYIMEDGKIVVSTKDGALPDDKNYQVAYYVYGETGSKDITVNSVEYLAVGNFSISYDQPRQISRQSF